MKKNIMKKWVKALRSDKFKQGTGTLKQFNSKGQAAHCCLGVLCELYNSEMKKNKKKTLSEKVIKGCDYIYGAVKFGTKTGDLPVKVMKWSGMRTNIGVIDNENYSDLVYLNDTSGRNFKKIASVIEKNWEIL